MPIGFEPIHFGKHKVQETSKSSEVSTKELQASFTGQLSPQALSQIKSFLKQGQDVPPSSLATPVVTSNTIEQQQSTKVATPITLLTLL
jgi:hypothetical protein